MTTVAVQTDDINYNTRSSELVSDTEKGARMYWSREAYMTWRVQHANPFYPLHKRRHVDYDPFEWVNQVIGLDYESRYNHDPEFAAVVDNSMVFEVEYDTETIHMQELRLLMEKYCFLGIFIGILKEPWTGNEM